MKYSIFCYIVNEHLLLKIKVINETDLSLSFVPAKTKDPIEAAKTPIKALYGNPPVAEQ